MLSDVVCCCQEMLLGGAVYHNINSSGQSQGAGQGGTQGGAGSYTPLTLGLIS